MSKEAKAKAKDLTNLFSYYVSVEKDLDDTRSYQQVMTENVKQCALIAVDEKIKTLINIIGDQKHMWSEHEKYSYNELQKVKSEIEKL